MSANFAKSYKLPSVLLLTLLLLAKVSPEVHALAGIAESTSNFHYNDFAHILRGHPSDLCSGSGPWGKWCLIPVRPDGSRFDQLNFSFHQINIPHDNASPYLLGERAHDNHWLIYDFNNKSIPIIERNRDAVLEYWQSLGMPEPQLVNGKNTRDWLTETDESVKLRWSIELQKWFFLGLIPLIPVVLIFWYLSHKSRQQYKQSGGIIFFLFGYIFLVPVALIIFIAMQSLIELIQHNW